MDLTSHHHVPSRTLSNPRVKHACDPIGLF